MLFTQSVSRWGMVIDTDTEIQTAHTIEDEGEYDVTVSVSV